MSETAPTWVEAVGRMAAVGYRSVAGRMRADRPDKYEEDTTADVRFWHVVPHCWRVEDEHGLKHVQDEHWRVFRDSDGRMQRMARAQGTMIFWGGHPWELLGGENDRIRRFTEPGGFSIPVEGPLAVEVAGRSAWEFTLAPPEDKPHPLRVACDDETGAVLRMAVPEADLVMEMVEFRPDVDIPEHLFQWDGPVTTDWADESRRDRRGDEWLRHHPPPVPRWWPGGMRYDPLHANPDTGAFSIQLDVAGSPALARWPRGGTPPEWRGRHEDRHIHRWNDASWSWALAVDEPLSDDDLARVIDSLIDPSAASQPQGREGE